MGEARIYIIAKNKVEILERDEIMQKTCTVAEVAEFLNVSTDSIYAMVREKQIPM